MKKRVLLSVLLSVMVFFMVACGNKEEEKPEDSSIAWTETVEEEPENSSVDGTETVGEEPENSSIDGTETVEEESENSSIDGAETDEKEASDSDDDTKEDTLKLELKGTDNPRINEILNISGTYTDSVGNTDHYSYQIPQFNADSESAKTVNQRIVDDIYPLVEEEFACIMSKEYSLLNYSITYKIIENGNIGALLVTVPYPNDCMAYYAYHFDFANNKEVTNIELLTMKGMTEESFVQTACDMGMEYFEGLFEGTGVDWMEEYKGCIEEAKAATTVNLPMYLDTDGTLKAYIPFPSAAGSSWYYHLCEF